MKNRTLRIGIVFGGKSAEHEVSIQSARNILAALDPERFEPVLIMIDRSGRWHLADAAALLDSGTDVYTADPHTTAGELAVMPGNAKNSLISPVAHDAIGALDVIFPILHGPLGEDGTVQGFLELADLPYVGPGVLGSAIGMDKDVMKRLLRDAGLMIADFLVVHQAERADFDPQNAVDSLGLPLFVKPANMGSSVGVSKVTSIDEVRLAVDAAFRYDRKVILERAIDGAEIECSVLGNDHPRVSLPGRVIPQADFYSYEAKYVDENGAILEIPAHLPAELVTKLQGTALKAFRILECEGLARVDMFLTHDGQVLVNEINTLPGFTKISMYPKLWEASDLSYSDLISQLIDLAIERWQQRHQLRSSYLVDASH